MSDTLIHDELSLKDAVQAGLVKYSTALKYITEGTLPARKIGREWHVSRADLAALANDPIVVVDPDVGELAGELRDPVREWALKEADSAPPMSAREARVIAAIFRRAAKGGANG